MVLYCNYLRIYIIAMRTIATVCIEASFWIDRADVNLEESNWEAGLGGAANDEEKLQSNSPDQISAVVLRPNILLIACD